MSFHLNLLLHLLFEFPLDFLPHLLLNLLLPDGFFLFLKFELALPLSFLGFLSLFLFLKVFFMFLLLKSLVFFDLLLGALLLEILLIYLVLNFLLRIGEVLCSLTEGRGWGGWFAHFAFVLVIRLVVHLLGKLTEV